jgi:hypothetical protein
MISSPVLLYSKYSNSYNMLINMCNSKPIDIPMICIDNKNVREQIKSSKTPIKVTTVPCIISTHPDGRVEVFESDRAFSWIEEKQNLLYPEPQPAPDTVKMAYPVSQNQVTDQIDSEDPDIEPQTIPPPRTIGENAQTSPTTTEEKDTTNISDILDDNSGMGNTRAKSNGSGLIERAHAMAKSRENADAKPGQPGFGKI